MATAFLIGLFVRLGTLYFLVIENLSERTSVNRSDFFLTRKCCTREKMNDEKKATVEIVWDD